MVCSVVGYEQVSVDRLTLPEMLSPSMITAPVTMEVEIRRFKETREQGNCRGNCAKPAHQRNSTKSRHSQETI
jgi:hypothetical protein